jgi:hypothetical protein
MPPMHLYQIAYNEATRAQIAPGWLVLDNSANPRPDWYEYWPIRHFLQTEPLDEAGFYGFFSPKFSAKTQLSLADVQAFVSRHADKADVLLFSPQPDMGAFFLNVFEQGETFDAGLIDAYSSFLVHIDRAAPLRSLVMDSRQIVFSNFFIARPAFWREWLLLNEAMFAVCEGLDTSASPELRQALTQPTTYATAGRPAERKVFLQERAASLLLATQPRWRSVAHNPFGFGWSMSRFRSHPTEAYISDALKMAWREQACPEYLQAFATVRNRFSQGTLPANGS